MLAMTAYSEKKITLKNDFMKIFFYDFCNLFVFLRWRMRQTKMNLISSVLFFVSKLVVRDHDTEKFMQQKRYWFACVIKGRFADHFPEQEKIST